MMSSPKCKQWISAVPLGQNKHVSFISPSSTSPVLAVLLKECLFCLCRANWDEVEMSCGKLGAGASRGRSSGPSGIWKKSPACCQCQNALLKKHLVTFLPPQTCPGHSMCFLQAGQVKPSMACLQSPWLECYMLFLPANRWSWQVLGLCLWVA